MRQRKYGSDSRREASTFCPDPTAPSRLRRGNLKEPRQRVECEILLVLTPADQTGMQPSDWIAIVAIVAAFLSPLVLVVLNARHIREERSDQREAEEKEKLRSASLQMMASARLYAFAAELFHANDVYAERFKNEPYDYDEEYERVRAAWADFAVAFAAFEIIAPDELLERARAWDEAIEQLVFTDEADLWTARLTAADEADARFLVSVRDYFGIPLSAAVLPRPRRAQLLPPSETDDCLPCVFLTPKGSTQRAWPRTTSTAGTVSSSLDNLATIWAVASPGAVNNGKRRVITRTCGSTIRSEARRTFLVDQNEIRWR